MKKKLLLMLMLTLAAMSAFSQSEVTVKLADQFGGSIAHLNAGQDVTKSVNDGLISLKFVCVQTKGDCSWVRKYFQIKNGSYLDISIKDGNTISKVEFTLNTTETKTTEVTVNDQVYPVSGDTFTWEGTAAQSVRLTNNAAEKFAFTAVRISFSGETKVTPAPVITPAAGTYFNNLDVTVAPGEGSPEGTVIYYTKGTYSLNSNEVPAPTVESDVYAGPISLPATYLKYAVKAIAVAPGYLPSVVAINEYQVSHSTKCHSIYQFLQDSPTSEGMVFEMTCDCTVVYQNGPVMFVTDGYNGLYVGGVPSGKYKEGDVITGFCGRYGDFRSQTGMTAVADSFKDALRNEPYVWKEGTYADLSDFGKMSNCSPYAVNTVFFKYNKEAEDYTVNGWLIFANGDKAPIYNALTQSSLAAPVEFPAMEGWYDVKGVTSIYETVETGSDDNITLHQFIPFSFTEAVADKTAVPVFEPEGGKYEFPVEVSVTSETPGAVIRYTMDGTEPTMDSEILSDRLMIEKVTTVKAFAVAQGFLPSDTIVSAYSNETGIEGVDAESGEAEYYDLLGRRVINPAAGLYIQRRNGTATTVMVK